MDKITRGREEARLVEEWELGTRKKKEIQIGHISSETKEVQMGAKSTSEGEGKGSFEQSTGR